jgi:hypothetical protein
MTGPDNVHPRQRTPKALGSAAVDGPRPERAAEAGDWIHTGRGRIRGVAAVLTPVVLAALILGCGAPGNRRDSVTLRSPATSGPHRASGLLDIGAHPLLTEEEGNPVRPRAVPVPLSACVSTPLTWGAAESDAATYGRPGQPRFGNEFVLRYDTVAAAHHAVTDAWRLFHECPTPHKVETGRWDLPVWGPRWHLDEYFANERVVFARLRDSRQLRNTAHLVSTYSLRVARRQNVVVVVETKGDEDRNEFVLSVAMAQATGDGRRERVILSEIGGGRDGW